MSKEANVVAVASAHSLLDNAARVRSTAMEDELCRRLSSVLLPPLLSPPQNSSHRNQYKITRSTAKKDYRTSGRDFRPFESKIPSCEGQKFICSIICKSNVLKDLKGVRSGPVRSGLVCRLYLLSSHVRTLLRKYCTVLFY